MSVDEPTREAFIDTYLAGIVINVIHGFTTALVLWFVALPMIHKLERIKIKYGMYYDLENIIKSIPKDFIDTFLLYGSVPNFVLSQ